VNAMGGVSPPPSTQSSPETDSSCFNWFQYCMQLFEPKNE
jgi:hypothetical protein